MRSGLLYSVLYGISLLVSLLVILLCIWIVSRGSRESTKRDVTKNFPPPTLMPEVQRQGKRTVWIASMILTLIMGLGAGYGIRDHQLVKNTHTYFDVLVVERYAADKYLLKPARMQPWISKTCEPLDLSAGHMMKFYTYEQMTDCHRVKSFEFYANSKGERIDASIQMR